MASIADRLPWEDVGRLDQSIDFSDAVGKRDRALLLLVATTGMRNGEVHRLEHHDTRWRQGEVLLQNTENRHARVVPLTREAEDALADDVLHGRPRVPVSRIFLTHRPPVRPIEASCTISDTVARQLRLLDIHPARAGTHLLRHSLATQTLQQGRPVKETADLLGHQSVESTAFHLRVALPQLASVALPLRTL